MLVSVYMPTKNRLQLMSKAVQSVLRQSHQALELIVVDDGSTDGTRDYLRSISAEDPRVQVITHDTSRGPQVSRNEAILAAKANFVTGIDDDDEFEPHRIEFFLKNWDLLHDMGLACAFLYSQDALYSNGELIGYSKKIGSVEEKDLLNANHVGNQVFAEKTSFLEAGNFDESLPAWQDLDMFIRMLRGGRRGYLLDAPTYLFDVTPRPDRISTQRECIHQAFRMIAATRNKQREKQQLMLQMFAAHYGFRPTLKDLHQFLRMGFWPSGSVRMAKRVLGLF